MKKAGFVLMCASVVAAGAISLRGTFAQGCCGGRTIYDLSTWWLVVLAGFAALLVRFASSERVLLAGAAISTAVGPQLAGTGVVAFRRWYTSAGFFGGPDRNLTAVRFFALVLCAGGLFITVTALSVLWRHGVSRAEMATLRMRQVAWVGATIIALTLPYWMGHGRPGSMTATALGAHALMYSLPWAFALAITVWLDALTASVLAVAVALSAVPLLGEYLMIWALHPTTAFGFSCLGAAAIVISRRPDRVAQQVVAQSPELETAPIR